MIEKLIISLDCSQGALLRVLGVIERRGWEVRALELDSEGSNGAMLRCEIERRTFHAGGIEVLLRHVEKLHCVSRAGIENTMMPHWPSARQGALQAVAAGGAT